MTLDYLQLALLIGLLLFAYPVVKRAVLSIQAAKLMMSIREIDRLRDWWNDLYHQHLQKDNTDEKVHRRIAEGFDLLTAKERAIHGQLYQVKSKLNPK